MTATRARDDGQERTPRPRSKGSWVRDPRITDRDLEILRWITRHGVVTTEFVGWRFFWRDDRNAYGEWAAYRRLAALSRLGLIIRNDNPFATNKDSRQVLRASRQGALLADVGVRQAPLVISELRHTLAVLTLAEYLIARYPGAELTTERELRAEWYRQRYSGAGSASLDHIPDALFRIPTTGPGAQGMMTVAVELDLSRKDRHALAEMIGRYDRMPVDVVWWYVKPVRLERIRALVAELGAQDRFKVLSWLG